MSKPTAEDYIKQGIYGPKELRPDEKRLFLGTFRERVVIALTQHQVKRDEVVPEVDQLIKQNKEAQLLLNGHIDYSFLSKYVQRANEHGTSYMMVTNKDYNSKYGLVLANDHAIHKENIHLQEEDRSTNSTEKGNMETGQHNKPAESFLKRLFKRNK